MSLDTDGCLLEGFRVAGADSPYTYPPRTLVADQAALDAPASRAEYAVWVGGQAAGAGGMEIADPALTFHWTRNDGTVVRFDWDGFSRRWATRPGAGQVTAGALGNSPRVTVPPPDPSVLASEAPFAVYIGSPDRLLTFSVSVVPTSASFGNPPTGTVEVSADSGELNWGTADLATALAGQPVYVARQAFFDRQKVRGAVGALPLSPFGSYALFLNPVPGLGQAPRVRIGYGRHLAGAQVPTEASLGSPASGTFTFAADTGRLRFSQPDLSAHPGETVYYDGVALGSFRLSRRLIGTTAGVWPAPSGSVPEFVGLSDPARYVLFAEPDAGPRYYYDLLLGHGPSTASLPLGSAYVDVDAGSFYVSALDPSAYAGTPVWYVDSVAAVERGVAAQFYRSAANGYGAEAVPDFREVWAVASQVVVDGLTAAPFALLPTVPIVDAALSYRVEAGAGGGTFTGDLADGEDPSLPGAGYLLDLDSKMLRLTVRKSAAVTLRAPCSALKLDDSAISTAGFQASRDGLPIVAGTDFGFNPDTGVVEFTAPVGESDPGNALGLSGTAVLPSTFAVRPGTFQSSQAGKVLLVGSGPNAGVYPIRQGASFDAVLVDGAFVQAGAMSADVRAAVEVLADRVWRPFAPPFKKLRLYRAPGAAGAFVLVPQDKFSVLASSGQVSLADPARPGEVLRVEYTSLDSADDGVTVTPTARTELAGFKVRQEEAAFAPGTTVLGFNPGGMTVVPERGISLYLDGVTQDPTSYAFAAPGTLSTAVPVTAARAVVDYWVAESPGGSTVFNVLHAPVDLDLPAVTAGSGTAQFNGDQSFLTSGCPVLIDDKAIALVSGSSYDAAADATTVTFSPAPQAGTDAGSRLKVAQSVTGARSVDEAAGVDVVPRGSNTLAVSGAASYPPGTVAFLDGDPYLVVASSYDAAAGVTKAVLATGAVRNYVLPAVRRTVRPILSPTQDLATSRPAHAGFPTTLFKVPASGAPSILISGLDYTMADGGLVRLSAAVSYGDALYAFYVARVDQPAGTSLSFNYAVYVAPSQANGMIGQRLVSSYSLYNPDTFFYRVETVAGFIPEVMDEVRKGSAVTSGPSTASAVSLAAKDYGSPSLWFDEQHWRNVDAVVARLLQFYNDQANHYEDLLASVDGRAVGGASGRFRFNGDLSGAARASYSEVQNDVDDQVRLYDRYALASLSPFTLSAVPVYGYMWDYNRLSRLFGTLRSKAPVALSGSVGSGDFGEVLGSFGVPNIASVDALSTASARAKFGSSSGFVIISAQMRTRYNLHRASTTYHLAADVVNVASMADPAGLAASVAAVNAMKAVLNAHLSQAGVHQMNDTVNVVTAQDATDLQSETYLVGLVEAAYNAHLSQAGVHGYDDLANMTYARFRTPVDAMSDFGTGNIAPLSGLATTADGVLFDTDGMRIHLVGQTALTENGPWTVHSGAWTRPADFAAGSHAYGAMFGIAGGATYGGQASICYTAAPDDVVGDDDITFTVLDSSSYSNEAGLLNELKARLNLHVVSPGSHVLLDSADVVSLPDLPTGSGFDMDLTLEMANTLMAAYEAHRVRNRVHVVPDTVDAVTAGYAHDDATLYALVLDLLALYNVHVAQVIGPYHVHGTNDVADVSTQPSGGGSTLLVTGANGDPGGLVPQFYVGQAVLLYPPDGSAPVPAHVVDLVSPVSYSALSTLLPHLPSMLVPAAAFLLVLDASISQTYGSVVADVSSPVNPGANPGVHFYQVGRHVSVSGDVGLVKNAQTLPLPADKLAGNEVVCADVSFQGGDTAPRRVPALDGSELADWGYMSDPPLTYQNELNLYQRELYGLALVGTGLTVPDATTVQVGSTGALVLAAGMTVHVLTGLNAGATVTVVSASGTGFTASAPLLVDPSAEGLSVDPYGAQPAQAGSGTTVPVSGTVRDANFAFGVGTQVRVVTGVNAGRTVVVTSVISSSAFQFTPVMWHDPAPADMYAVAHLGDLQDLAAAEVGLLTGNSASAPTTGLIGILAAEAACAMAAAAALGLSVAAGTGTASGVTLADGSQGFAQVDGTCCVLVSSGPDLGVYKVLSAAPGALTLDTSWPFSPFPSAGAVQYSVVRPWPFVTPRQAQFLARFVREALAMSSASSAWSSSITYAGVAGRVSALTARQAYLGQAMAAVSDLLMNSDFVYDMRYALIRQRVDKVDGTLTRAVQAASRRADDAAKLVADQRKALMLSGLVNP